MRSTLRLWPAFALGVALCVTLPACPDDADPAETDDAADAAPVDTLAADTSAGPTAADLVMAVPQTGAFTVAGLQAPVQVVMGAAGVPFIHAASEHDLYLAHGFVVSRDRFVMLELLRRASLGTLAEVFGDLALGNDFEARASGSRFIAERLYGLMSPEEMARLEAFAAGVNAWIAAVRAGDEPVPPTLALLGPLLGSPDDGASLLRDFEPLDLVGAAVFAVFYASYETGDVGRAAAVARLGDLFDGAPLADYRRAGAWEDVWEAMAPLHAGGSAPGWGLEVGSGAAPAEDPALQLEATYDATAAQGAGARRARAASDKSAAAASRPGSLARRTNRAMLERAAARSERLQARLHRPTDVDYGSNEWAVMGAKGKDGVTLLAADGHLDLDVPSFFYQIGLDTSVFGGDEFRQKGLVIPGIFQLAVGTNGKVAWTQTQESGDITDWYREELELDADGRPSASRFAGQWRPLLAYDEVYEVADIPSIGSVGRSETWTRWTTFDGRWITDVEGRVVEPDAEVAAGEAIINAAGTFIVPGDQDGDGVITAISFDYTGLDLGNLLAASHQWGTSADVWEFLDAMKFITTYSQNMAAADRNGNVLYTGYQSVPCRGYLPRGEDGRWIDGADPRLLLDGTTYPGFTVPVTDRGRVDEGPGQTDPAKCVVPFDAYPQSLSPDRGYVVNANNDPGSITVDGDLYDEPWYIGGPWTVGHRASTIARELDAAIAEGSADVAKMAEIQGNVRSRTAEDFLPWLLSGVAVAKGHLANGATEGPEGRMAAAYADAAAAVDEAVTRLSAWRDRGLQARSGVATFYNQSPPEDERRDAVATMIWNAWFPRYVALALDDEGLPVWQGGGRHGRLRLLHQMLAGRGPDNPTGLASWVPEREESAFFDVRGTEPLETSDELAITTLVDALAWLAGPSEGPASGGFETDDMDAWLWGLRHQVRFESLIVNQIGDDDLFELILGDFRITTSVLPLSDPKPPPGDPRRGLTWFPRDGDNNSVDAANPGMSGTRFSYGAGPVMRMVVGFEPGGRVTGLNVIPGGQSGDPASPHFADQAALWLGNQALPLDYHVDEMVEAAVGRVALSPPND